MRNKFKLYLSHIKAMFFFTVKFKRNKFNTRGRFSNAKKKIVRFKYYIFYLCINILFHFFFFMYTTFPTGKITKITIILKSKKKKKNWRKNYFYTKKEDAGRICYR